MSEIVALTGANGYVGGLIAAALAPQARVVALVRKPRDGADLAWSLDMDEAAMTAVLKASGATALVHAAWDMQSSNPDVIEKRCVDGSRRLFAAARAAEVGTIVFISTISAFDGARSVYGAAKRAVEREVLALGGVALRLGLVAGQGGMMRSLRELAARARIAPMIGDGSAPQYLLPEPALQETVRRAIAGDFSAYGKPITLADRRPVAFRDILQDLAREQGRTITLVPVPWRLIHLALSAAERARLPVKTRSDSVISFIYQNPAPDFSALDALKIDVTA